MKPMHLIRKETQVREDGVQELPIIAHVSVLIASIHENWFTNANTQGQSKSKG